MPFYLILKERRKRMPIRPNDATLIVLGYLLSGFLVVILCG